ncbi:MAG: hypothetical protein U0790_02320 [Isosphaeraceae bacterium]
MAVLLFVTFYGIGCLNPLPSILGREPEQGSRGRSGLGLSVPHITAIQATGSTLGPTIALLLVPRLGRWPRPRLRVALSGLATGVTLAGFAGLMRWVTPGLGPTATSSLIAVAMTIFTTAQSILLAEVTGFAIAHLRGDQVGFFSLRAWGSGAFAVSGPINSSFVLLLEGRPSPASLLPLAIGAGSFAAICLLAATLPPSGKSIGPQCDGNPAGFDLPVLDRRATYFLLALIGAIALCATPYGLANNYIGRLPGIDQPDLVQTPLAISGEILLLSFGMRWLVRTVALGRLLLVAPGAWMFLYLAFFASSALGTTWPALIGLLGQAGNLSFGILAMLLLDQAHRADASARGSTPAATVMALQGAGGLIGAIMTSLAGPRDQAELTNWMPLWSAGAVASLAGLFLAMLVQAPAQAVPHLTRTQPRLEGAPTNAHRN